MIEERVVSFHSMNEPTWRLLEMICADFLAGASINGSNPEILLQSISRYYKFLPSTQKEAFLSEVHRKAS
jgi:hypothetical protein